MHRNLIGGTAMPHTASGWNARSQAGKAVCVLLSVFLIPSIF